METTIFYYTGSGNSLWVAKRLGEALGGCQLVSVTAWMKDRKKIQTSRVGLVFPVHMWGVPPPIVHFIEALKDLHCEYFFAVGVNAGQVANTLVQLKGLMSRNGLRLDSAFEVPMPSNYIPFGGPGPKEKLDLIYTTANQKIGRISEAIMKKEKGCIEKGPLWQRAVFSMLYKLSYRQVPKMDRAFTVDAKCSHCGICSRICPSGNITMVDGSPTWNHHCEQCYACLQWCPMEAIQYGQKTAQYPRYHHPEIDLKEMLKNKE